MVSVKAGAWKWVGLADGTNVRFGSKADMCSAKCHVRFTPESGHVQCTSDVRFVPKADSCSAAEDMCLFDDLICGSKQRRRDI